jgi:hypothetical protein
MRQSGVGYAALRLGKYGGPTRRMTAWRRRLRRLPAAVMLGGMATYFGETVDRNLRAKDVVAWLQRFPGEAIVYASGDESPAIVVRDKDNRRHLASLSAPQPPSAQ